MTDFYHILGLGPHASAEEIRLAYRKLALRFHPDKNPESAWAEERFKQISEAYRILSKPESRRQYDVLRAYAKQQETSISSQAAPEPAPSRPERRTPPPPPPSYKARPGMNQKQHIQGTAWAFGIMLLLIFVTLGGRAFQNYQKEKEAIRQQQLASSMFQQAEKYMAEGNYSLAYELLKSLEENIHFRQKAWKLRASLLASLLMRAELLLENGAYREAASLFQLYISINPQYQPQAYAQLALSYEKSRQWHEAAQIYEEVLVQEPRSIEARNLAAEIYAQHLQNYEKARELYGQAAQLVRQEYQETYGSAYPLTVHPNRVPDSHIRLHIGLGNTLLQLGRIEEAANAYKWALRLRPKLAEALYGYGQCLSLLGHSREACAYWSAAANEQYVAAEEALQQNCPD